MNGFKRLHVFSVCVYACVRISVQVHVLRWAKELDALFASVPSLSSLPPFLSLSLFLYPRDFLEALDLSYSMCHFFCRSTFA